MWLYLGSSCLDRPSSEELSTAEVDSRIHKVLDLGVNPNPGASPAPLHEGVTSARVSKLSPILALRRVLGAAVVSHEMSTRSRMWQGGRRRMPPKRKCRLREREKESPSCRWTGGDGARGGHPPRSGSSGEGEEVRRIALPPSSSPRITLPLLRDMVCWQVGTTVNERVLKRPQIGTETPTDSLGWLHLTQVTSDHEERDELSSHVNGTCNTLCY
jgi:hypothetical protein